MGEGGCGEDGEIEGAGEVFSEDACPVLASVEIWFGLSPDVDRAGDRSWAGRGEMGTFQMTASSGNSSSSSSHSASLSLTVFLFVSCHDCRLVLSEGEGNMSMLRELRRERVRGAEEAECALDGEGEREERLGAARLMLARDGAEGDVKPLRDSFPGAESWPCWRWTAWLTGPLRLGYFGFAVPVKSRNAGADGCGCMCEWERLRGARDAFGASKTMRLEGLLGSGNEAGAVEAARRSMSSKCERSLGPRHSERVDE